MKAVAIAKKLTALGERQGKTTVQAADILCGLLVDAGIPYHIESIDTYLPRASSRLVVDGKEVDSAPTSFTSGTITGKDSVVSSLIPTRYLIDVPNINFNPRSSALSRPNFYFAPSLAIRRKDLAKVLAAKNVRGIVRVAKERFSLPQILVGNRKNPEAIVFAHYDSIGPGAIDNASGTAACMALLLQEPALLERNLFVFDPNEELSYDFPTYWGHGYRVFEKRHSDLLRRTKKIISVDCVGNGKARVITDPRILNLAFPIIGLKRLLPKTLTIGADIDAMLEVYQGDTDLPRLLSEDSLKNAVQLLRKLLIGKSAVV